MVFTKYAAPGEKARVQITKSKKNHGEAKLLELVHPAIDRVTPRCPLFTHCGGCSWQHLPIEIQREWKERIVRDSLRPLPDSSLIDVRPLVASPDTWRYRNKMEFTFSGGGDQPIVAGFHTPGNWWRILDVHQCYLGPEGMEKLLRAAVEEGEKQSCSTWDGRRHAGTLRHLVVRHSVEEDAYLAMMLTGDRELDFEKFADALLAAEPKLKGLAWGLNDAKSDVARASEILGQRGEESFIERLGKFRFQISLASFFQTNSRGAEKLYEVAREALSLDGSQQLLDAYCGTGTIGIFCSDQVRNLYGIEIIREAIWDARSNAAKNGVENATFMVGDMRHALPVLLNSVVGRIDRLVVDPPRGGMDKKALEKLLNIRAPIVVYVSCNPTTMARDLEAALAAGYRIDYVTPVDMFPHTHHVECVARLVLNQ